MVKQLEQHMKEGEIPGGDVYIAMASRPREGRSREDMNNPITKFADLLDLRGAENLHFRFQDFPEEHHNSVWPFAFYNGLKHIFDGYEPAPDQFSQRPETILPHYQKISERLGTQLLPPESLLEQTEQWLLFDATATAEADRNKMQKGLEILKINVETYPESYHAHQALADAYMTFGNKEMAKKHYEHSLELNPQNENVRDRLEALKP